MFAAFVRNPDAGPYIIRNKQRLKTTQKLCPSSRINTHTSHGRKTHSMNSIVYTRHYIIYIYTPQNKQSHRACPEAPTEYRQICRSVRNTQHAKSTAFSFSFILISVNSCLSSARVGSCACKTVSKIVWNRFRWGDNKARYEFMFTLFPFSGLVFTGDSWNWFLADSTSTECMVCWL